MSKLMRIFRFASAGLMVGLVVFELPGKAEISTLDSTRNDYRTCATTLLRLKVSTEEVATACGRAFKPEDLSVCVQRTVEVGNVPLPETLSACRNVRRPVEMASCVVDIRRQLSDTAPSEVLDRCRRSLLPERYANCVTGINSPITTSSSAKLTTCLDASDFSQELDPSVIPYTRPEGSQLPPVPSELISPTLSPGTSSPDVRPSPISTPPGQI
ncbi:MAG TPA: hypothetical protein V6D18_01695 [Thermosynechococcaceae cyanobacterium]